MKEERAINAEEVQLIISIANKDAEIWVESEGGGVFPVGDYDYDLENNRIILRLAE